MRGPNSCSLRTESLGILSYGRCGKASSSRQKEEGEERFKALVQGGVVGGPYSIS